MATTSTESARRRSVLLAAIGYLARKDGNRESLSVGAVRVQGNVDATVGRSVVAYPFAGELRVSADQETASTSGADPARVLAIALSQLPSDAARTRFIEKLVAHFESNGELPTVSEEHHAAAKGALERLRSKRTIQKRGAVVFQSMSD